MKPTTLLAVLAPVSVLALAASLHVARTAEARAGVRGYWDEEIVEFVRARVAASYVDELSDKQMKDAFYAAVEGYLKSLPDEYNHFIPPDEYRKWTEDTAGRYAGVGVKVQSNAQGIGVAGVFPGGPAAAAGIRIGEVITHVDGRPMAGFDTAVANPNVQLLKGPQGSTVTATVMTPPAEGAPADAAPRVRDVVLTRAFIQPPTVFPRRLGANGSVGYLRVTEFVETTITEFDRALDPMIADGVKTVVVDLRGNGGGVLPATVHLADRFLPGGEIVRLQGRDASARRVHVAKEDGTVPASVGLVVLVDGRSASASEVFAGCIQDYRRGVLLGTRTYGKFLVQNITEIPGRGAGVKITTARYQTPNGRSYQRPPRDTHGGPCGLIPDVVVELSEGDAETLEKAWRNEDDAVWGASPRHADVAPDWIDPQLRRALDLIAGNLLLQEIRSGSSPGNG